VSEKTARGFSTSIYVTDKQAFEECKRLLKLQGRSLSEELMGFVLRRLDELRGTVNPGTSDEEASRKYEDLKDKHSKLRAQYKKRLKDLSTSSEFQKANELLRGVGLLADLSNAADIIPKFIAEWKKTHTDVGFMHEYVSFVELAVKKMQLEQKLDQLRPAANAPAIATIPIAPQQNIEKALIEKEEPLEREDDEDEHEENPGEDDDEE
jgi:hypothetical protein